MKPKRINFKEIYKTESIDLSHNIHSYTAKMIPQISRYLIERFSEKDDLVLDPFCGSGTTLLEACLLERNAVGIDINPLASLISKVKTTPLDASKLDLAIRFLVGRLKDSGSRAMVDFPNIDYWFCEQAKEELSKIKFCIETGGEFDENIRDFMLVSFSSIIRKSSYADPRMAKTYKSKRVLKKIKDGWVPLPLQYFEDALRRNFERITTTSINANLRNHFAKVFTGDAKAAQSILKRNGIGKVDLIVTSPPYINAQDYFRSYKLELWWLGLATPNEVSCLNKRAIGTERISGFDCQNMPRSQYRLLESIIRRIWSKTNPMSKRKAYIVNEYFAKMETVLRMLHRALKQKGFLCIVTGNNTICEVQIPTYRILAQIAEENGFALSETYCDEIRNRSLFLERNHKGGIIKEEWITVFQKE